MYCIHCGKEISEGTRFCIYCGKQQIIKAEETHRNEPQNRFNLQGDQQKASPLEQAPDAESPVSNTTANQQEKAGIEEVEQELKNIDVNTGETAHNDTRCPFCGSDHCQPMYKTMTETNAKSYGWGSGCCGMLLLGPFGLLCGFCGAGLKTKTSSELWWTCIQCGKQHLALPDGLKKWNDYISKLPMGACTVGILFLIIHYLELGIIGVILKIICIFVPAIAVYGLHEEISEELGGSILTHLSPEQMKSCCWSILGAMVIILVIGLLELPILQNILGE